MSSFSPIPKFIIWPYWDALVLCVHTDACDDKAASDLVIRSAATFERIREDVELMEKLSPERAFLGGIFLNL